MRLDSEQAHFLPFHFSNSNYDDDGGQGTQDNFAQNDEGDLNDEEGDDPVPDSFN